MKFELNAEKRDEQGSGASRRLRRAGKVPGIVYGLGVDPVVVALDHNEFFVNLRKEAFQSSVITLKLDGAEHNVILRDVQLHAYKPLALHVDFQRVDTSKAIHQNVPLHFINADIAPGVKVGGGKVAMIMKDVAIACLPQDLPSFIEVDLKDMKSGQSLHLSQLVYPQGVQPVAQADDLVVVSIIGKKGRGDDAAEGAAE